MENIHNTVGKNVHKYIITVQPIQTQVPKTTTFHWPVHFICEKIPYKMSKEKASKKIPTLLGLVG